MKESSLLKNLRDRIAEHGVPDVAREAGMAPTTLYSFIDDKTRGLRSSTLEKLSAAVARLDSREPSSDTDEARLSSGLQKHGSITVAGQAFTAIPVYDIAAAAGAGALVEDGMPTAHQLFRERWLRSITKARYTDLSVISVTGDSMWETLHQGDMVLVDRSVKRVVREGIYILLFEDELLVKRCQRDLSTGELIVKSDNPKYETVRVTETDRINVIGRVIWIGRAMG